MRERCLEGVEVFGGRGDARRRGGAFRGGGGLRNRGMFSESSEFFLEKGGIFVGRGISEEGEVFGGGVAFS